MKYLWLTLCILLSSVVMNAQQVQVGIVVDAETGKPIGGASLRVNGSTRGTYTHTNGTFRLPIVYGTTSLLVRSIGYAEATVAVAPSQNLTIKLKSVGVTKHGVEVLGNIEASEVVRRAIARARQNDERLRSLVSTTYSKMRLYIDASAFADARQPRESITETFATVYYQRYPERRKHVRIEQRRQTRNIASNSNLAVFDEFVDITKPEIQMLGTRLVTPLASDALDTYTYHITNRRMMDSTLVYDLSFEPSSMLYPGFKGTLSIVDGTYQTIAADFGPTEETAIPFVTSLHYVQRYDRISDSVWVPMYQLVSGGAAVSVIAGLAEIEMKLQIEAYVTDVQANVEIADSLFMEPSDTIRSSAQAESGGVTVRVRADHSVVSVANDADSIRPEFWEQHAFSEMSAQEKEAYHIADSVVANRSPATETESPKIGLITVGPVGINILPILTRTTITGWMGGAELEFIGGGLTVAPAAAWGEQGTNAGNVSLKLEALRSTDVNLVLDGNIFSTYATIQPTRSILGKPNLFNLADLLYMDYADYYRKDGWEAGVGVITSVASIRMWYEWSRQFASALLKPVSRTVLLPDAGNYQVFSVAADFNSSSYAETLMGQTKAVSGNIVGTYGTDKNTNKHFSTIRAGLSAKIPTFSTGYQPMRLDVDISASYVVSATAPKQYQFSLLTRLPVFENTTNLATVRVNEFGGMSALLLHAEHNFSDLWWRAISLPTFKNGRGLDLLMLYGAGRTTNSTPTDTQTWKATNGVYQEVGFALGRIPTFVSDLFYLRFDALWPVGNVALPTGTFGWSVTLSSPLF